MKLKTKLTSLYLAICSLFTTVFAYDGDAVIKDVLKTDSEGSLDGSMTTINDTLVKILGFARGAGIVVCVIMLVWCAIQLASSAGNNQKRQIAMEGIKNVLIAVAIVGGATLICSLAYGILK